MQAPTAHDFKQNLNDGALRDTVIESTIADRYALLPSCDSLPRPLMTCLVFY